jgi:hypothetical protein
MMVSIGTAPVRCATKQQPVAVASTTSTTTATSGLQQRTFRFQLGFTKEQNV